MMADQQARKMAIIYEKRFARGLLDFYAKHLGIIESNHFVDLLDDAYMQEIRGKELLEKIHKHKCDFKDKISEEMYYIITKD